MDPVLLVVHLMLGALGVVGVAAAEPGLALEHGLRVVAAFGLTAVVAFVPTRRIVKLSPAFYLTVLALLAAVLVVGISPAGGDALRWIALGPITLQASELMKVAVIAYLTAFFHNHLGDWQIWRPMVVIGLAAGLIVVEPDISTAAFLFALAFAIMLAAGTTLVRLVSISTAAALLALLVGGAFLGEYAYIGDRIAGFADLWGDRAATQDLSYQALQARSALLEGGVVGIGPGPTVAVPEAHTDMVAVSVGQSLGLLGMVTLVALYGVLGGRGALNLLVSAGLLPVTGVPLPFVSYGLNSLVSTAIAMGFLHAAYREARLVDDAYDDGSELEAF